MKIRIGEIVPAQTVADAAGVSRRTITRNAEKAGALVEIGGRGYVFRNKLRKVVDDGRWTPALETLVRPVPGHGEINPEDVVSRNRAAKRIGCNLSTVWRTAHRFGIGVDCWGDRLLTEKMMPRLRECVGKPSASPEEISEMKRRAVNARWSRQRGEKSGKSGRGAASSPARRSRAVSR